MTTVNPQIIMVLIMQFRICLILSRKGRKGSPVRGTMIKSQRQTLVSMLLSKFTTVQRGQRHLTKTKTILHPFITFKVIIVCGFTVYIIDYPQKDVTKV